MALVNGAKRAMMATVAAGACAMSGCDEKNPAAADVMPVKIAGKTFYLEIAAEGEVRAKGLGGRKHIEDNGGMIFSMPPSQVGVQTFVMRDCPIPIDIMYLDGAGRVLTTYTMQPEEPRKADGNEGTEGDFLEKVPASKKYENRLSKKYTSRFPSPFIIELKDGTITRLGVKEGDLVTFDIPALKKRTK